MKGYIHYLWGSYPKYEVNSTADCKDVVDESAYNEFVRSGGEDIKMGKVLVSKYP